MSKAVIEGERRRAQVEALEWCWYLLGNDSREASRAKIMDYIAAIARGEPVDFSNMTLQMQMVSL